MINKTEALWYPYAQMKGIENNYEVSAAQGVYLELADGRRLIDAISSWWCVIHGYNHPSLNQVLKDQIDRVSHLMLGGLKNRPAVDLAEKLVEITPEGLNHVFFGDSGSVGVEIALKMAAQFFANQNLSQKSKMVALHRAYHGDTSGCMSVCDPAEGMHKLFSGIVPQQYFLNAPQGGFEAGADQVATDLAEAETLFKDHHDQIAGVILEPLMQAAGGFNFYSPAYLQGLRMLCDRYNILLIFDEVATGFGRTGTMFAADKAMVCPDIMVLGKGLTAGYMGHSATLATSRVFSAFYSDSAADAFMHGPTFMGNPLACALGLESIRLFEQDDLISKIERIEQNMRTALIDFSAPQIKATRVLGATGVIEVQNKKALDGVQEFAMKRGVWLRPFETYLYTMPAYTISDNELDKVLDTMCAWFSKN